MSLRDIYTAAARTRSAPPERLELFAQNALRRKDDSLLGWVLSALGDEHPEVTRRVCLAALRTQDTMILQQVLGREAITSAELVELGRDLPEDRAVEVADLLGNGFAGDLTPLADALWEHGTPAVRQALLSAEIGRELPEHWIEWALDPTQTGQPLETVISRLHESAPLVAVTLAVRGRCVSGLRILVVEDPELLERHDVLASVVETLLHEPVSPDVIRLAIDVARFRPTEGLTGDLLEGLLRVARASKDEWLLRFLANAALIEISLDELAPAQVPALLSRERLTTEPSTLPGAPSTSVAERVAALLEGRTSSWRVEAAQAVLRERVLSLREVRPLLSEDEFLDLANGMYLGNLQRDFANGGLDRETFLALPVTPGLGITPEVGEVLYQHLAREVSDEATWAALDVLGEQFTGTWGQLLAAAHSFR